MTKSFRIRAFQPKFMSQFQGFCKILFRLREISIKNFGVAGWSAKLYTDLWQSGIGSLVGVTVQSTTFYDSKLVGNAQLQLPQIQRRRETVACLSRAPLSAPKLRRSSRGWTLRNNIERPPIWPDKTGKLGELNFRFFFLRKRVERCCGSRGTSRPKLASWTIHTSWKTSRESSFNTNKSFAGDWYFL